MQVFTFTKAKDKVLVQHKPILNAGGVIPADYVEPQFKIVLKYFELYILRKVFEPKLTDSINNALAKKINDEGRFLRYFYNRVQVYSELLPGNTLSFERYKILYI